jgi:hypothetical protein
MPRTLIAYDTADPAVSDLQTPTCLFCRQDGWVQVPTTAVEQMAAGDPIQDALPDLAPALREQIISGIHPECSPF